MSKSRRRSRAPLEIFSLSFLDIISCGFGAVVLLVLISDHAEQTVQGDTSEAVSLLEQIVQGQNEVKGLEAKLVSSETELQSSETLLERLEAAARRAAATTNSDRERIEALNKDKQGLELVQQSLNRARTTQNTATVRDEEVGGIPVDSDHVVFIIDTSGSMQQIWGRVLRELENIINIHPNVKGFQILNDNGAHLLSAYQGRWIPDTPGRRKSAINLLRTWNKASNSSPVEGLEIALKRYASPRQSVAIYIFGDEYSGNTYEAVLTSLDRLNRNNVSGGRLARVHAVGFLSNFSTGRFATLMREVVRRNNGTFVALPK